MSLQSIIDISNQLEINRRKLVGVQYARNQLPRVSETPTYNPWKLTVGTPTLPYSTMRTVLENIDTLDRRTPQEITFSNNAGLSWMFAYRGTLTSVQRAQVTFDFFEDNQMTLDVSALIGESSSSIILEVGDIIQIQGYPYPFTSISRVTRGTGLTVTVTTHRPNILSTMPSVGTLFNWGNDVRFNMFCPNMPTYKLTPGGFLKSGDTVINNALVEFTDNFLLYEYVASA